MTEIHLVQLLLACLPLAVDTHQNSVAVSRLFVVPEAPRVSTHDMGPVVGSLHVALLDVACSATHIIVGI